MGKEAVILATSSETLATDDTQLGELAVEDAKTLRRVIDDIPIGVWVVALVSLAERFAFWGMTAPWQNYMQNDLHQKARPGALGLGQATATNIYYAFYLFYYITPLAAAVISDTRLGRYKTLCISSIFYLLGFLIIFVTSLPVALRHGAGLPGLASGMALIGLGGGAFKAIMAPFIADQYTRIHPVIKTTANGERVITDRALTLQYIYNVYYWVGNIGSLSWFASTYIEKLVGFWAAYLMTVCSLFVAAILLVLGKKVLIRPPPEGNILPRVSKVLLSASRHGFSLEATEPAHQREAYGKEVPWESHFVAEVRRGIIACKVLVAFVTFYICYNQMQNNLVSQAGQMETNGVPNDFVPAMNQVACIVLGPMIQHGLYPFLNKHRIAFRPIARITVGFIFVVASMAYAAVVQHLIYQRGPCYDTPLECAASRGAVPNQINVWIQTPVFVLIAFGEIFAYVTGLEYAYAKAPNGMKTIVQAISLLVAGVGAALGMAISPVAKDPKLVIMYASVAGIMAITTIGFWIGFRSYDSIDEELDSLEVNSNSVETVSEMVVTADAKLAV